MSPIDKVRICKADDPPSENLHSVPLIVLPLGAPRGFSTLDKLPFFRGPISRRPAPQAYLGESGLFSLVAPLSKGPKNVQVVALYVSLLDWRAG
jgi:hypothetical protein